MLSPSAMQGYNEMTAITEPGSKFSLDLESAFISDFLASRTMWNKFKPLNPGYFAMIT